MNRLKNLKNTEWNALKNKISLRNPNIYKKQMPIREPDLLIILTGGQMAYTRPDGVKIIPLGCLKD